MISFYIIAYNEEEIIARCIDSFKPCVDEIVVVVDSKTTDRTAEIARGLGAKVFPFTWIDDFSAMKNFGLDHCNGDWRMYADADDVLDPDSLQRVRDAVKYADANGFNMITSEYYTMHDADGKPTANNRVPRLVKAGVSRWRCRIHEYQECGLPRQYISNIEIHHKKPVGRAGGTQRNMTMLENALADPTCDEIEKPRYLFYLAREYMFSARYQDAVDTFNKYIPISTYPAERHRAMCDRADCYSLMGEKNEAVKSLCEAIDFMPDLPDPYIKMGIIAYNNEDWIMCVKWLRDAAARSENIHPLFPLASYNSYLPYDYMSVAYHKMGEVEKAYVCELKVYKCLKNDVRIIENIKMFEKTLGLT